MSLICGLRTERGKACPDTAARVARGSGPSSRTCEGLSTDAGCAGGPACSSDEDPAGRGGVGAKGPGHPWLVRLANRHPGGASWACRQICVTDCLKVPL